MKIEYLLILLIVYLLLSFWLFQLGAHKKIGSWKLGLISLLLSPIVGFAVWYFSSSNMIEIEKRFWCPECKYEFTQQSEYCPMCMKTGKQIRLTQVNRNMI